MHAQTLETITPPVLGESVWAFDADDFNVASWVATPAVWRNAILEFHADGEAFAFGFGAAITTVAATTDTTVTSNEVAAQGDCAYVLPNGARVKVDMSRLKGSKGDRLAILGITGTANNKLRVTLCTGYIQG